MINNALRKQIILILSLIISFGVFGAVKGKKDKKDEVSFIEIYTVNILMDTQFAVYCDVFWENFKDDIKKYTIKDKCRINRILNGLKGSRKVSTTQIDARSKLFIYYYSGKIDSICLTRTGEYLYNNSKFILNSNDVLILVDSFYHSAN